MLKREDRIKERKGRGTMADTSKIVVSFSSIPVKILINVEKPYLYCVFCVYRFLSFENPLWTISFSTVDPKLQTASGDIAEIEHKDVIIY